MRNTEERVLAVQLKVKAIETKKRKTKRQLINCSAVAFSLVLIVGLSILIPGIMETISDSNYNNLGAFASIFKGSDFLGYVLIGILAFALGVSATILSYKIKKRDQLLEKEREGGDD